MSDMITKEEHQKAMVELIEFFEKWLLDGYSYAAIEYELNSLKQRIKEKSDE